MSSDVDKIEFTGPTGKDHLLMRREGKRVITLLAPGRSTFVLDGAQAAELGRWLAGREFDDDAAREDAPAGDGDIWPTVGARCQQIGGARRYGTVITDIYSGYVTVRWDPDTTETHVHIRDIKPTKVVTE